MDWKKETISPAEFERREREYISAAVAMMKRSTGSVKDGIAEKPAPADVSPEIIPEKSVTAEAAADKDVNTEVITDKEPGKEVITDKDLSEEEERDTDDSTEENKDKDESTEEAETSGENQSKFGVYSADEIADSQFGNDGLKKAAEILEEMAKNTAIMRKFAETGSVSDSDITDFPDFSFRESGNSGFREEGKQNVTEQRKKE